MYAWLSYLGKWTQDTIKALTDFSSVKNGSAQPDPYFSSKKVFGLNDVNFDSFLKTKDVVMVMFYNNQEPNCPWLGKHLNKAAEQTTMPGHVYAAVDCEKNSDLCLDADVTKIPNFQIYHRGQRMPFFKPDLSRFQYMDMKLWVSGQADINTSKICKK